MTTFIARMNVSGYSLTADPVLLSLTMKPLCIEQYILMLPQQDISLYHQSTKFDLSPFLPNSNLTRFKTDNSEWQAQ